MGVYGDRRSRSGWPTYKERGQKLDMGKSCLRFTSLDESARRGRRHHCESHGQTLDYQAG